MLLGVSDQRYFRTYEGTSRQAVNHWHGITGYQRGYNQTLCLHTRAHWGSSENYAVQLGNDP